MALLCVDSVVESLPVDDITKEMEKDQCFRVSGNQFGATHLHFTLAGNSTIIRAGIFSSIHSSVNNRSRYNWKTI